MNVHCGKEDVCWMYRENPSTTKVRCMRNHPGCATCSSDTRSRSIAASQPTSGPKFNSADLLLLAHDEWKRREERKHNHENAPWCAGFINGFLTDKKWAREMVDKIQKDAEDKHRSKAGAP